MAIDGFSIARTKTTGSGCNYVGWAHGYIVSVDVDRIDGNTRFTATATDVGTEENPRWVEATEVTWCHYPLDGMGQRVWAGEAADLACNKLDTIPKY